MNDSCVLLVSLNWLLSIKIPNVDEFVIARDDVGRSGGELTVSDPIIVLFEG